MKVLEGQEKNRPRGGRVNLQEARKEADQSQIRREVFKFIY